MTMFSGYKTYIVSVMVMLIALASAVGIDIPGVDIGGSWFDYMMAGAFGMTFRSALAKYFPN